MRLFLVGPQGGWKKEQRTQRVGEGVWGEWLWTGLSAADYFLNALADPPGQRNGVTEMPQSSEVHMDGGLC